MALLQQNLIVERKDQEMLYFKFRRTQIQRMKPKEIFYTVSYKALCELHFFSFWWKSSNFDENNQKKVFWFWLEGDKKLFVRWKDSVPASFRMNQSISDEFHYLKPQTRLPNFLYDRVTWEYCSLKVQNVEFEMDVSFWH